MTDAVWKQSSPYRLATFEELQTAFLYDPETGKLYWKTSNRGRKEGTEAGCFNKGYRVLKFQGRQYEVHRIIWKMTKNEWPVCVDHINHDRGDNRLVNLRNVSYGENQLNRKEPRPAITQNSGIRLNPSGSFAAFTVGSRNRKYLGTRSTLEQALELQRLNCGA